MLIILPSSIEYGIIDIQRMDLTSFNVQQMRYFVFIVDSEAVAVFKPMLPKTKYYILCFLFQTSSEYQRDAVMIM